MQKFERLPSDILSRIPRAADVLRQDPNVVFAYLFGGLASGCPKPLSDVDVAVFLRTTDNPAERKLDLFERLAAALGTAEVDLVVLNTARQPGRQGPRQPSGACGQETCPAPRL